MADHHWDNAYSPSRYRDNIARAFPKGTLYDSIGFELPFATSTTNEPISLPPELDIILITGASSPSAQGVCERFAQDFDFYFLDVHEYLHSLAEQGEAAGPALGPLRPTVLREVLEAGNAVPSFFLLQILRWKIDEEVRGGRRRFMVAGLDEDAESAIRFGEEIAEPAAVFSFVRSDKANGEEELNGEEEVEGEEELEGEEEMYAEEGMNWEDDMSYGEEANGEEDSSEGPLSSDARAEIEAYYANIAYQIDVREDDAAEEVYEGLFAVISRMACASIGMGMEV